MRVRAAGVGVVAEGQAGAGERRAQGACHLLRGGRGRTRDAGALALAFAAGGLLESAICLGALLRRGRGEVGNGRPIILVALVRPGGGRQGELGGGTLRVRVALLRRCLRRRLGDLRRCLGDVVVIAAGVGLGVWARRRHHHGVVPEGRDCFALSLLAVKRLGELAQRVRKNPHVGSRVGRAAGGALHAGAVLAARASGPRLPGDDVVGLEIAVLVRDAGGRVDRADEMGIDGGGVVLYLLRACRVVGAEESVQATRGGEGGPLEQAYVLRDLDDFGLRDGRGSVVPEEELQGDLKEGGAAESQLQGVGLDDTMPVGEEIGTLLVETLVEVGVEKRVPAPGERLRRCVEDGEA